MSKRLLARLVGALLALGTVACSSTDNEAKSACEVFDVDDANALVTNSDTGVRKVEGEIIASVIVRTGRVIPEESPIGSGALIGIVAINVGGKMVTLAHGMDTVIYYSLDEVSETATGFPSAEGIGISEELDEVAAARECAETGDTATTVESSSDFDVERWRSEAIRRFGAEEAHSDGSRDDYVQLARTVCMQGPAEREVLIQNLGDRYKNSLQRFIIDEFCPNAES